MIVDVSSCSCLGERPGPFGSLEEEEKDIVGMKKEGLGANVWRTGHDLILLAWLLVYAVCFEESVWTELARSYKRKNGPLISLIVRVNLGVGMGEKGPVVSTIISFARWD